MLKVRGWRQEMWGVPSVKQMRSPHRCQNSLQRTRSGGKITPSWAFYLARKNINRVDMWKLFWEFVGKHWYLNSMAFLILSFFDVDFGVWIARVPLSFHSGQSFVVLESVHFTLALWSHFTSKLLVQWDTVSCHWTCWTCYCSPNLRWGNSEFHLGWNDAILPSLGSLWIPIIWRNSPLPFFFSGGLSPSHRDDIFFSRVVGVPQFQCKSASFKVRVTSTLSLYCKILLMDKILHHQGWWLSHYL